MRLRDICSAVSECYAYVMRMSRENNNLAGGGDVRGHLTICGSEYTTRYTARRRVCSMLHRTQRMPRPSSSSVQCANSSMLAAKNLKGVEPTRRAGDASGRPKRPTCVPVARTV